MMKSGDDRYVPDRGDYVWIDLDPQAGHEQAGHRPALVLSPKITNALGFATVVPITNTVRGSRFEVPIPPGSETSGVILAHHFKSLDIRARRCTPKGRADPKTLREVTRRVLPLVDPEGEFILMADEGESGDE
jgi:mRNA interferase MazF